MQSTPNIDTQTNRNHTTNNGNSNHFMKYKTRMRLSQQPRLSRTRCPIDLLKKINEWGDKYNSHVQEFSEEEKDRLRLLKWNSWVRSNQ